MSLSDVKVMGIGFSPRKGGNSEILLREALAGAEECQARAELLAIREKDIQPCDGCSTCARTGKCHIKDDMVPIYDQLLAADGLIFASPVYFWGVPGPGKTFIDRLLPLYHSGQLRNKVGSAIAVATRQGDTEIRTLFYTFFAANHMITGDFVQGFARDRGQITKDRWAMKASRELGREMVSIISQRLKYPEDIAPLLMGKIKAKYGIESCPALGRFDAEDSASVGKEER